MPLLLQKRKHKRDVATMTRNVGLAVSRLNHRTTINAARISVIKAFPTSNNHSKNSGGRIMSINASGSRPCCFQSRVSR